MFSKNVGKFDRILRVVVGVSLLAMFFIFPDAGWRYFTLIGIIPLLTGLFGTCAIYSILRIGTAAKK